MEIYETEGTSKIIFAGLDKSGKTSIIRTLKKELENLEDLKPTKSIERHKLEFMDKKLIAWDFGGQEKYRKTYIAKPENYFSNSRYCVYIIDIQDSKRYDESLNYLRGIVEIIERFELKCKISVLFHKRDPNLNEKMQKKIQKRIPKLKTDLKDIIKEKYNLEIFQTSIYDELSLTEAFSKTLSD